MPKLEDILNDKTTYPDTQTIQLADGVTATLGELRGGFLRTSDYTKKTTDLARQRDELQSDYQNRMTALQTAEARLMELAKQVVGPKQEPTKDDVQDLVQSDPVAARLMNEISQLRTGMAQFQDYVKRNEERYQQSQMAGLEAQHRAMLSHLKSLDPDLDEKELTDWAIRNHTPRLDVAYNAMTREKAIEKARIAALEEGEKKGREKAVLEFQTPQIPLRMPGVRPENAPKTLDEAAEMALRDPEVINPLYGIKS